MTTLQEAARKALASLELYDHEDLASCEARHELRTALAQQELPQKERPDFMAGYDAGMADAKRMAQQGAPVEGLNRSYTEQLINALHENSDPVSIDAAEEFQRLLASAPAPQAQEPATSDEWLANCPQEVRDFANKLKAVPQAQPVQEKRPINCGTGHCSCIECLFEPAPQPAQGGVTRRKIFVCAHCDGIYADQTVTQCDCMEGTGADFVEGFAEYPAALQSAQPKQEPLTGEAIYSIVFREFKCVPLPYDIRLTRAIEASHGINGMVEAATRPAIDAAIKQGGQHDHHD